MRPTIPNKAALHAATPTVCLVALLLGSTQPAFAQPAAGDPPAPEPKAPAPATEATEGSEATDGTEAEPAPIVTEKLTPPSLKKDAQPVYPLEAKAQGIGAVVVVDIDIDANGLVETAVITKGADDPKPWQLPNV